MKFLTGYYKRLKITYLKCACLIIFLASLFLPSYTPLVSTGDNLFHIYLNGQPVGVLADTESAERCLIDARRQLQMSSDQLVLTPAELTWEGSEVMRGEIDGKHQVTENMIKVLRADQKQVLTRAFALKVGQYNVNLSSTDEVLQLLQAALDRFDTEGAYRAQLELDEDRELTVLAGSAVDEREQVAEEEPNNGNVGIFAWFDEVYANAGQNREKDFSDYQLGLISMNFPDQIEVVECYLNPDEITDLDTAISEVTKDQEKEETYEVVAGDTLSQIAEKTQIPMDKLIEMNEILENENSMIRIGDELVITVPQPDLSVDRQEELYYEEDYEAEIVYVDNDEWYTTQQVTLQEPSAGHRKVVAIKNYHNDKVVSTEILKEEVTYEAVAKVVERGTKIPPTYVKPISGGRLTSNFGRRKSPTKGASSYHKGVDWSVPVGTAVMASASGVVTRAGWGSGYGYCVYIRHADGRETRYGHLSKVLVSVGQSVSQGQKIALSGNTGISTGPHLHFEILIGGSQVNPLKYLN